MYQFYNCKTIDMRIHYTSIKKTQEFALKLFYSKFALAKKGADSVAQLVEHSALRKGPVVL